jgi:hypothetical protein
MKAFFASVLILSSVSALANDRMAWESIGIRNLVAATKQLAASDLSCGSARDCVVVEIGALACGGPQEGVLTSRSNMNLAEVRLLAQRTSEKEAEYNARWGIVSHCMAPAMPTPACVNNRCVPLQR